MTDPGRAGESAGEDSPVEERSDQEDTAPADSDGDAGQVSDAAKASEEVHDTGEPSEAGETGEAAQQEPSAAEPEAETSDVEDTPPNQQNRYRKGLLIGLGSGALVGIIAGLAFAGLVKPSFLVGPGKPDDKASEAVMALGSKNADAMAKASCHSPDGKLSQQLPPQALQLIQSAKPTGPPQLSLDTEALVPVSLTLTQQGQSQTIPVDIVLGVANGKWCVNGIAQQQQQ